MAKIPTYNLSYWERETFFHDLDVAVVGGGIVGLCSAIFLKKNKPHLKVAVIDRGVLPLGASTRNAGFACFGSPTELLADLRTQPDDAVFALVEKRWRGLALLRSLVGDAVMRYEGLGGYEIFTEYDEEDFAESARILPYLNDRIGKITGLEQTYRHADEQMPRFGFQGVEHLILNQAEGQIHTGLMMRTLIQMTQAAGIQLFNGLHIDGIESDTNGAWLHSASGWKLRASRVLVTTNGFVKQLIPEIADMYPARNLVLITKRIPNLSVEGSFHYDRGYFYFRNIDGRILLGGGRNLAEDAEKTAQFGTNDLIQSALVHLLHTVIAPNQSVEVDSWWSGILGLGAQKSPIIRWVRPNVAVAVRLGGMGVAIGSLVGEEAAKLVGE